MDRINLRRQRWRCSVLTVDDNCDRITKADQLLNGWDSGGPDRLFLLSNLYLSRDIYFLFYPRSSSRRNVITVRRNANYKQKTKHKRKDHHSFLVLARSLGTVRFVSCLIIKVTLDFSFPSCPLLIISAEKQFVGSMETPKDIGQAFSYCRISSGRYETEGRIAHQDIHPYVIEGLLFIKQTLMRIFLYVFHHSERYTINVKTMNIASQFGIHDKRCWMIEREREREKRKRWKLTFLPFFRQESCGAGSPRARQ